MTAAWYLFGTLIEAELRKSSLSKMSKLRQSFEDNTTRLRSAVALVTKEGLV